MTAEEYLNDQHVYFEALKDKGVLRVVHSIMNEYAELKKSEWCRQQREICADRLFLIENEAGEDIIDRELVLNSPEPKGETE